MSEVKNKILFNCLRFLNDFLFLIKTLRVVEKKRFISIVLWPDCKGTLTHTRIERSQWSLQSAELSLVSPPKKKIDKSDLYLWASEEELTQ